MAEWLWLILSLLCAMLFIGIGIYAIRAKKPIHFWAGSPVRSEEIRDIPAYNKANGIMWILFGAVFVLVGMIGFTGQIGLAALFMGVVCIGGVPVLILAYQNIYKKYKK